MEITAVPLELMTGQGYALSFFSDDTETAIVGGFINEFIYFDSTRQQKVMWRIDNYSNLENEFRALEKEMGYPG